MRDDEANGGVGAAQARVWSARLIEHDYQRYCGLELVRQAPGFCRCRLQVVERIGNLGDTLHGGVLYSMFDVVSMLATLPLLADGEYALTSSFNCMLLSGAPLGAWITLEATVVRDGRNLIFSRCDAWKEVGHDKRAIATAQLSKFRLPAPVTRST
ncbi:thioesterase [Burkholderia ubonensis]|uniref:Thioesterase n=1 Tax=Burkholderia ubonensis TaxID=101571 RepID=A0A118HPS8_9BURK|nr:PaaI family thioesterase [Burkholderia ubonensis]AOJ65527.1 thioesterase [Burkholderia ubonensis]KVG61055.1 thioesterase [Burkholderia ubonensis]